MKIFFVSLGCDKNLVDSEEMLALLEKRGYSFTDDETQADVIIINTCCFINDAKEESVQTILEMSEYKKENCKALIVTGCMAQRYKQEILDEVPEVDMVLGTTAYDKIVEAIDEALAGKQKSRDRVFKYASENRCGPCAHNRRTLCVSEDRRGLQQVLYVLHHPEGARPLPQCTDGRTDCAGKGSCR